MYWVFVSLMIFGILGGWVVPFVLVARAERRARRYALRQARKGKTLDRRHLAMLAGGPDRVVQTVVVELIGRHAVIVEHGSLAVVADRAPDSADPVERAVLDAIREVGHAGITAVRAHVPDHLCTPSARWLSRKRLTTNTFRRAAHAATHSVVASAFLTTAMVGASVSPPAAPAHPVELLIIIVMGVGWLLPPAIVGVLTRSHPVTDRGKAVLERARRELTDTAADRVAAWGIAAFHPYRQALLDRPIVHKGLNGPPPEDRVGT